MKLLYATSILIFFAIIILLFNNDKEEEFSDADLSKKIVEVKTIRSESFIKKLKLRGFTQASRVVTIKSQVEGKIANKNFSKGNFYDAGKQILLIDPEDKIAKVKEMEALLNQRKKEFEIAEKLFNQGFRSEIKLTESRTNFEKALAKFEKSQIQLNNTKIIIPFDSFVEESYVELGDYLKKGDSIAKIVDLDPIFINLTTSEKDIAKIKVGQYTNVLIFQDELEGIINFVSKTADPKTRSFKIQVEINNLQKKILSGLSAEINISLDPVKAFFVASSLISLNSSGEIGLKIIAQNIVDFLPIEILSDTGSGYWIKFKKKLVDDEINVITQGHEYTTKGESVEFKLTND